MLTSNKNQTCFLRARFMKKSGKLEEDYSRIKQEELNK